MSRVIVIGATGHIGSYLVPRLVRGGHEVIAMSRGARDPYHPSPQWGSVSRVTVDRDVEDEQGTFGARIAALRPDMVIDLSSSPTGPSSCARSVPSTPRPPASTPSAASPRASTRPGRCSGMRRGTARWTPCTRRCPGWWPTARPTSAARNSRPRHLASAGAEKALGGLCYGRSLLSNASSPPWSPNQRIRAFLACNRRASLASFASSPGN